MKNTLEYKGYWTVVEYSTEDRVLHGRIEGIRDVINYESDTIDGVETAFREAVDDYLLYCRDLGVDPEKPYSGSFNVRVPKEVHRAAALQAKLQGISLNQWVSNAMAQALR
ncbi:MAG: type II toxin-antitoxin system HicB family antitoxin [Lachnospiraceae bacterium]|nr:type II toxin-antitoxin system HicB family antitoxin [Lachnospiraceae bacterium]